MRMIAQFDTGEPRYSWLTSGLFIGEGRIAGDHQIEYSIHRVDTRAPGSGSAYGTVLGPSSRAACPAPSAFGLVELNGRSA